MKKYIIKNDIIYFEVTSDGTSGPDWIKRLEDKGFRISDYAKNILKSKDFKPTKGVTYRLVAIRGTFWKTDGERLTRNIRAEADKRSWAKPNAEVACLFRELFTDDQLKEMGLWYLVAMHEPIKDSGGDPRLLSADRRGDDLWLNAGWDGPGSFWFDGGAFVFVLPQVLGTKSLEPQALDLEILSLKIKCKSKNL